MATIWSPISNSVPQFSKNAGGAAAADYYLKFYYSGTTQPATMATDSSGQTLLDKCKINSLGYPVNGSDEVFVPHIAHTYKLALYTNATDADNNATGSAAWVVDGLSFSAEASNTSVLVENQTATDQQATFTLSNSYVPGLNNLAIYRNGVRITNTSYTEVDVNTVRIDVPSVNAIEAGDIFTFVVNENRFSPEVGASTVREELTATSNGQTVFNLNIGYVPGVNNLSVYRNGAKIPLSAYVETDANTVTFTASEAANIVIGDEFEFIVNERDVSTATTPASNVTYTPAGTGAVVTDVQTRLRKQILATDYTTLAKAITAAIGNELIIPAGTYTFDSRLAITLAGVQDISIRGAGRELTKLVFTGDTVGLDITIDNAEYIDGTALNLEGFSIITTQDKVATAISVNGGHLTGFTATGPIFEKIVMRGNDTATGWLKGISLTDTAKTEINNVFYLGKRNDKTTTGLEITGTNSASDHIVRGFRAIFFNKAIDVSGTIEGLYADSCVLVSGARGISWETTANEPLLNLNNSHINTYEYGVYGVRCNQSFITNNLIYQDPTGGANWTAVFLTNSNHTQVTGNTIHGWNVAGDKNGVFVGSNSSHVNVDGNIIRAINGSWPITTGVFIDATNSDCKVGSQNIYDNVTREVDNQSGESVGITYFDSVVATLTGGAATETLDIAITPTIFSGKPEVAMLTQASGTDQILARYEYDDAATDNNTVRFTLYTSDGSNITAGSVRFSIIVAEGYLT